MQKLIVSLLGGAALAFFAGGANATILTFDGNICGGLGPCSNSSFIDHTYGDGPNIDVKYDRFNDATMQNLSFWIADYSDLTNVAWGQNCQGCGLGSRIVLQPDAGFQVELVALDLGAWPHSTHDSQLTILDGLGNLLLATGNITIDGTNHSHFNLGFTEASGIQIIWGPDSYNIGIDNIEFLVSSTGPQNVPEPATLTLLGAGLASFAASRRRRKAKA